MKRKSKPRWVTVKVTRDLIGRARRQDCYFCLIALALRDATGYAWHVWFSTAEVEDWIGSGKRRTWKMTDDVRRLRSAFDAGEYVEPCEFRLPARFAGKALAA
ncbi:MAG TPA: hypothetical protein VEA69_16880 [Tepidisphaeraceae bacterium]|nr:hypothetical protein [Tepidisphaeraceae bacterium]